MSSSSSKSGVVDVVFDEEEGVSFRGSLSSAELDDDADVEAGDPAAGRALSMDSVPATTRYTVPAALATRSAVFFNVAHGQLVVFYTWTHRLFYW